MPYTYRYPRPALTVDCVVFGLDDGELKIVLIRRARDPFAGCWAFPGGFVEVGESPEAAARRELEEETGLRLARVEQLYAFGEPDRDPREHVVSIAHYALVNVAGRRVRAADDAREAGWFSACKPPPLAFDHDKMLRMACRRLREEAGRRPIVFDLLPRWFTLAQLEGAYEAILEENLDRPRFRRRMRESGLLVDAEPTRDRSTRRAAPLYRFNRRAYRRLAGRGTRFDRLGR